jgi:hypothetical protein
MILNTLRTISSSIHSIPRAPRVSICKHCPFLVLSPLFFGLGITECRPILLCVHGELFGGSRVSSRLWSSLGQPSNDIKTTRNESSLPPTSEDVTALSLYF